MNKKGVEISFSWMFGIIVGVILLIFFVYFAFKQVGLFNKIGINEVVESINNEINAFSTSGSSNKIVELPSDVVFSFRCGDVIYKNAKKDTNNLIYGDNVFRNRFNLWTKSWVFPFRIGNFYYASNLENRYFILGNENFFFNIPSKFKKFNSINEELKKDDIIIDFTNSNIYSKYRENRVLVVDKDNGIITFYPENKRDEFFGEEMLYGGLFSNYNEYNCLKNKALRKLGLITELYKKKADLLKINSKCSFQYNELQKSLDLFKKDPKNYKDAIIEQNEQIKRNSCIGAF